MVSFTNISGTTEIGSNSYLLDIDGTRIVLDSGMNPKKEGLEAIPDFDAIGRVLGEDTPLDAIFITHSHLDHIGTLPVLQERRPEAEVFMTHATAALTEIMLHNSINVMEAKRIDLGIADYPFFTHDELDNLSESWHARHYDEAFRVGFGKNVLATLYDAGHIMGSAGVLLEGISGDTVFYTGDVQFENQSLIPGADFPTEGVDTLIMECTRGDFHRSVHYNRNEEIERLGQCIADTLERGGAVLIPVFALGKSQELLYILHKLKERGAFPRKTPIYFGGLSAKVTKLFDKFADKIPRFHPEFLLREQVDTAPVPRKGKAPLRCEAGNIYLVSSGMMSEKTLSNNMAEQIISQERSSVLFVGYCDPESPAGVLKTIPRGEHVRLRHNGRPVQRNCSIESFDFSGHASRELLVDYALRLKPKRVILVHGDGDAVEWMKTRLNEGLPGADIIAPECGKTYTF